MAFTDYDVIIIGGGPAGLSAAIYTSRAGLSTLLLERETMGGELINREMIENYPGFGEGIEGPELAAGMAEQAMTYGAEFDFGEVESISTIGETKMVKTDSNSYSCKSVIITSGSLPRKLGVPGEDEFDHNGVFYCATCDGPQYTGKEVVVAGAGDSGITDALALARICTKVTVLEFMAQPKASKVLLDRADEDPKITVKCNAKITAVTGDDHMTGVDYEDRETGEVCHIDAEGLLVRIGLLPNTQFLEGFLDLTPTKQVPVDENMQTVVPGIYAAGDVRQYSPMQICTAAGDGVTAAMAAGRYIQTLG